MRFDDRLATLLTLPVAGAHDRAVRWRQLVELAARAGREDETGAPFIAAIAVIRADAPRIPREVRAAAARAIAGRPLALPLLELFAEDELSVAAPLLAGYRLGKAQLQRLLDVADPEVRAFLITLHPAMAEDGEGGLSSIVARLSQRAAAPGEDESKAGPDQTSVLPAAPDQPSEWPVEPSSAPQPDAPVARDEVLPLEPGLFRWESDASGEIDWVDGVPRGAIIGLTLSNPDEAGAIANAFAGHEAFAAVPLEIAPLGAEYLVSGTPAFDPETGRFLGYRGEARVAPSDARDHGLPRPPASPERPRPPATTRNVESLRELVHEIKTPLNAIIGFAEIIDGQFLGPAHRGYRERAAEIVAQARVLLGAIEDLDFAAREQASRAAGEDAIAPETDLSTVVDKVASALRPQAKRKGVRLVVEFDATDHDCRLDEGLAERLVRRLFSSLLETLGEGETLYAQSKRAGSHCQLEVARPAALERLSAQRLLDPGLNLSGEGGQAALLGLGFSLRLVRGLVRIAGGELTIDPDKIILHLPVAKP